MDVEHHVIKLAQGMAQQIIGGGLRDILTRQAFPKAGSRPFFCVCCWFPSGLGVGHTIGVQLGKRVAQHPRGGQSIPKVLAVEHIGDPPRAELKAFIAHGAGVGFLKLLPVRYRPRVCPTPCVYHALGFKLSELHAIRPAHGRKGTDAAGKAAGQLLHLADLALVFRYIGNGHAKGRSGVDLVHVLALGEDGQLVVPTA